MTNQRKPYGPKGDPAKAKLVVVAEAPAQAELAIGRPLIGPSGQLFNESIRRAGIDRSSCYITNVFDRMVKRNAKSEAVTDRNAPHFELWHPKHGFTAEGRDDIERLTKELEACKNASTILCLGAIALAAVAGSDKAKITKFRGSIYPSKISKHKVVGTIHPAAVFRGKFEWRYLIDYDTRRVAHEMTFDGIKDLGHKFEMATPFDEAMKRLKWIKQTQKVVAWDIEVIGRQCAMIGFTWTPVDCISINLPAYSLAQEVDLWVAMADIIEDPNIENVVQNGMFDVSFLAMHCNVRTRGKIHDTMLKHHIMYHEFPASLAFMQSLYTDIPYHKDMVKHGDIEKDGG